MRIKTLWDCGVILVETMLADVFSFYNCLGSKSDLLRSYQSGSKRLYM